MNFDLPNKLLCIIVAQRYLGEEASGKTRRQQDIVDVFEDDEEVEESLMHEVRQEAKHIRFSREHFARVEQLRAQTASSLTENTRTALPSGRAKTDEEEELEFQKALEEFNGDVDKLLKSLDLDGSGEDLVSESDANLHLGSEDEAFDQDFDPEQMAELLKQFEADDVAGEVGEEEEFAPLPSIAGKSPGYKRVNGDVTNQLVQLLDGGDSKSSPNDTLAVSKEDLLSDEKIDELWDMVEFGTNRKD